MDGDDALRLYEKIRDNPTLLAIVELAGRLRRFGMSCQKRKTKHGAQDFCGIGMGGLREISRLVPSELMALGVPALKMDVLRRIAEEQAMVRKYTNTDPVAKGPVVGCFDESISMDTGYGMSSPLNQCKALALTMAFIAKQQGRWCCLIAFSSQYQRRVLILPPDKWNDDAIIAWLLGNLRGGTSPPVSDMPALFAQIGAPKGKTDLVYVTDGEVAIDPATADQFNAWRHDKTVNARVTTLLVGCGAGGMESISDEVHLVSKIAVDQEGVKAALSF
jgi:uncharacterized protein with von Willebrand factor type A (vWA) domain